VLAKGRASARRQRKPSWSARRNAAGEREEVVAGAEGQQRAHHAVRSALQSLDEEDHRRLEDAQAARDVAHQAHDDRRHEDGEDLE
jgi:hypothetical protein